MTATGVPSFTKKLQPPNRLPSARTTPSEPAFASSSAVIVNERFRIGAALT